VDYLGQIFGRAGISPIHDEASAICELQKMYFLPHAPDLDIGTQMMDLYLYSAKEFGFQKCY
jgi:putative acetyltransferase